MTTNAPAVAFPNSFTISFKHSLKYTNHHPIPAEEVADALLAFTRVVDRVPKIFRAIADTPTPRIHVYVEKMEEGSLTEDIVMRLFFKSQKDMDRTLKKWNKVLGIDLTKPTGVIRAIVIGLILVGVFKAIDIAGDKLFFTTATPGTTVEIKDNTVIVLGANELGMTPQDFVNLVDASVNRKNSLAVDAVKVVRPAKRDNKAEIQIDGDESLKIPYDVIAAAPSEVPADKSEDVTPLSNVEVMLRAADLDSGSKGWAAVIPTVSAKRLPLEIDPAVDVEKLFGQRSVIGNVEVVKRLTPAGKLKLHSYRLVGLPPQ